MPSASFFFDAGSGTALWSMTAQDREEWGYAIDPARLPISQTLRDGINSLVARYDTSLNWDYPPDPGPWRESECRQFNEEVSQILDRLRDELGPTWQISNAFFELHEDPDLDRYLTNPAKFRRTNRR
ncbi:hypothetical protein [Streptomyces lunalinharesii]|uniref:Uncharacterized protein n=1 Tax=Streptomyces lunalinharesii TaxID=333384 RepID=A0ABN3T1T3_9ACTN